MTGNRVTTFMSGSKKEVCVTVKAGGKCGKRTVISNSVVAAWETLVFIQSQAPAVASIVVIKKNLQSSPGQSHFSVT